MLYEYIQATKDIKDWIDFKGTGMSFRNAATEIIANNLYYDGIYDEVSFNGKTHPIKSNKRIKHTYPHMKGYCLTDLPIWIILNSLHFFIKLILEL